REGGRGFAGGSSLAHFLAEHGKKRNVRQLPPLTEQQILAWADAHYQRTRSWPTAKSRDIPDTGGEKWSAVDMALRHGVRHLVGGSSLAQLLAKHRGVRNRKALPDLTDEQILAWADAHHQRTGAWPTARSGAVEDAAGETWMAINLALNHGQR